MLPPDIYKDVQFAYTVPTKFLENNVVSSLPQNASKEFSNTVKMT